MESIDVPGVLQEAGMLTQRPTADLKCKLNVSSFLTLAHLLDCLICTRDYMSIVLLLEMMGNRIGGWGGGGWREGAIILQFLVLFSFGFVFCCVISCPFFRWLEHDSCCVCFFVFFCAFLEKLVSQCFSPCVIKEKTCYIENYSRRKKFVKFDWIYLSSCYNPQATARFLASIPLADDVQILSN